MAPRTEYVLTSTAAGYTEAMERLAKGTPLSGAVDAPPASLANDTVFLNGVLLAVGDDGVLPAISGKVVSDPGAPPFTVPPYSYGFAVLTSTKVAACTA